MNLLSKFSHKDKLFWEKTFIPTDLTYFYELVKNYFVGQGTSIEIKDGFVVFQGAEEKIDLRNVAQTCHQTSKHQWENIIKSYVIQNQKIMGRILGSEKNSFNEAKDVLAVRIWPIGTLKNVGAKNLIYRENIEGTISTLVLDLPDSIQAVTPKMATSWEKSFDDLFDIGLQNVKRICKPDFVDVTLANDIKVVMISKEKDLFTATHALFINDYPPCLGTHGSLIGISVCDLIMCYPVNEKLTKLVLNELAFVANDVFQQGPGSISPFLYWFHENSYSAIKIYEREKKIVLPPGINEYLVP